MIVSFFGKKGERREGHRDEKQSDKDRCCWACLLCLTLVCESDAKSSSVITDSLSDTEEHNRLLCWL